LTNITASIQDDQSQDDICGVVWNFLQFIKKNETRIGSEIIQDYLGWHLLSGVGVVGTFFNLFLMHCFYAERAVLATSVNAMICMDTLHKVIYSTIIVHWRNYGMISGRPVMDEWLGTQNVRKNLNTLGLI
jgi:hypothetical protein